MSDIRARKPAKTSISNGVEERNGGIDDDDDDGGIDGIGKRYDGNKLKNASVMNPIHWFVIIVFFASIYAVCKYLDAGMPIALTDSAAGTRRFSEERARRHLDALTSFGPRTSGSHAAEVLARNYLLQELNAIKSRLNTDEYRMEVDVQKPSGCYDLDFLSDFVLCYKNVTNIIVRFGRRSERPADRSLLLNCHFDSVPSSPGATDDAISCAIMLELLNIFSQQNRNVYEQIPHDLIFLFNGAEENFLQASHGFITQHPWRHAIRSFINLEGCGAGGREMLFQSGPGNTWLLHAYLNNAPYPHGSIMAQEIFQAGLVLGDTDYRILRDFGHIPGMDFAYIKNGYVYHTEFDTPKMVTSGSLQRAGENLFETVLGILRSPCFIKPCPEQERKMVFFDVIGQFVMQYPLAYGTILNYLTVILVIIDIFGQIKKHRETSIDGYSTHTAALAFGIHGLATVVMLVVAWLMTQVTLVLNLTLCWYSRHFLVFPLYMAPTLLAGLVVHWLASRYLMPAATSINEPFRRERASFDTSLVYYGGFLFMLTWYGLGSAYYMLLHTLFPLSRHALLYAYSKFISSRKNATVLLMCHLIALTPVILLGAYGLLSVLDFFIPIFGRTGAALNPEFGISAICCTCSVGLILYMGGMVYVSRQVGDLLKYMFAIIVLVIAVSALTSFGSPYSYDPVEPRLRRLHLQHVARKIYDKTDKLNISDSGVLFLSMDYRGGHDLPLTTFVQGARAAECLTEDAYCNLPYYVPVKDIFPPESILWMNMVNPPTFESPIEITQTKREIVGKGLIKLSFSVTGSDHMGLFLTPIDFWTLHEWSFSKKVSQTQITYVVYLANVGQVGPWEFSVTLKHSYQTKSNTYNDPKLLLGVSSHYIHGPAQHSEATAALIRTVKERRQNPPPTYDFWKWAMTVDAYSSEYVAKYFS